MSRSSQARLTHPAFPATNPTAVERGGKLPPQFLKTIAAAQAVGFLPAPLAPIVSRIGPCERLSRGEAVAGNVVAVPPAAAQCREQGGGVGIAVGLRPDQIEAGASVSSLGGEQPQIIDLAEL